MNFTVRPAGRYDNIYNESGELCYKAKYSGGEESRFGHIEIVDEFDDIVGNVHMDNGRFEVYCDQRHIGRFKKNFLTQQFTNDYNDWHTEGNLASTYGIVSNRDGYIGGVKKKLLTRVYEIEVDDEEYELEMICIALAVENQ